MNMASWVWIIIFDIKPDVLILMHGAAMIYSWKEERTSHRVNYRNCSGSWKHTGLESIQKKVQFCLQIKQTLTRTISVFCCSSSKLQVNFLVFVFLRDFPRTTRYTHNTHTIVDPSQKHVVYQTSTNHPSVQNKSQTHHKKTNYINKTTDFNKWWINYI